MCLFSQTNLLTLNAMLAADGETEINLLERQATTLWWLREGLLGVV
jgi:hypothetical protein